MNSLRDAVSLIFVLGCLLSWSIASPDLSWEDGDADLTSFVTRPEIKAPRFNVNINEGNRHRLAPGYWFVAPYASITQQTQADRYYQPCQTGPAIYDNDGELVWSGACMMRNQNNCDFRAWVFNGTFYLSSILFAYHGIGDDTGHGVIMDSSYNIIKNLTIAPELTVWNMHELHLSEDGNRARYMTFRIIRADVRALDLAGVEYGWIGDVGIVDTDLATGTNYFEWWAEGSGAISVAESLHDPQPLRERGELYPNAWDFIHANSIDLNSEGDYLFSGRYTDTIYKISGETGNVVWRLGGHNSTYEIEDFHFARQHDARTIAINGTTEIISFLDNASDDDIEIADTSSAKIVALDRTAMKAKLVQSIERPDGELSRMRGNYQILPNGNHFISWSDNAYTTEHTPEGDLIMEAQWASTRFVTYRGYKFDFVGKPTEPPTLVAKAYGQVPTRSVTAVYVSWNGATEVQAWRFHGTAKKDGLDANPDIRSQLIGEKAKTGFETLFYTNELYTEIYAEALNSDGQVLGVTPFQAVLTPDEWQGGVQQDTSSRASTKVDGTAGGATSMLDACSERITTIVHYRPNIFVSAAMLISLAFLVRVVILRCSNRRLKRSWLFRKRSG